MMRRVYKLAALIVIPLALASALIEPVKLPLGIVAGAVLAAVNFRGMHRNLQGLMETERPTVKLAVLSVVRLLIVFTAIILLAALKAVNLIGLMVGFTVVVVLVVKEGYSESQRELP
ncbi:MAG: ATP synthase subunit I [Nitrospirota bacterium]|jgi:hypothetical protein